MTETIESFVAKLQTEGVQAGREAAEKIRTDADAQAKQILQQANEQAQQIAEQARTDAEAIVAKGRTELQLAARDAVLRLQDTLAGSLKAVLTQPVKDQLEKTDFLASLLHDIVMQYARADSDHTDTIKINVSDEQFKKLSEWAIGELHKAAEGSGASINLRGKLTQAGFEYTVSGSTVEVTTESVVETLGELVGPQLREMLAQSGKNGQ